jgi:uncharacterized membrane protein YcfT
LPAGHHRHLISLAQRFFERTLALQAVVIGLLSCLLARLPFGIALAATLRDQARTLRNGAKSSRPGAFVVRSQPMAQAHPPVPSGGLEESRVAWIDVAKGMCIIFVVATHSTLGVGDAMGRTGFMHYVVEFSRPFRMPEFFMISGLFLSRVIDRDWRTYGDKRVVHFLYFYLLWLLIHSGVKYQQVSGGTIEGFLEHLAYSLVEPFSILWFIYLLAVFSVVTKLLRRVYPPVLLIAAAALEIAPIETNWYLLNEFCNRYVYFVAGYILAPHVFRMAAWVAAHRGLALLTLAAWALVDGLATMTPSGIEAFPTVASLPFLSLVFGGAGTIATVFTAVLIARTALAEPLRYAGAHALIVYLALVFPMAATRVLLLRYSGIEDVGVISLIVTVAAFVTPLIFERLVRDTPAFFLVRRPVAFHIDRQRRLQLLPAE